MIEPHRTLLFGSIIGMAREKVTVTLDRAKADEARAVLGAKSMSDAIDIALDRLLHAELLRRDVEAYSRRPPTDDEIALGEVDVELNLDDDDVDYDALYSSSD